MYGLAVIHTARKTYTDLDHGKIEYDLNVVSVDEAARIHDR